MYIYILTLSLLFWNSREGLSFMDNSGGRVYTYICCAQRQGHQAPPGGEGAFGSRNGVITGKTGKTGTIKLRKLRKLRKLSQKSWIAGGAPSEVCVQAPSEVFVWLLRSRLHLYSPQLLKFSSAQRLVVQFGLLTSDGGCLQGLHSQGW